MGSADGEAVAAVEKITIPCDFGGIKEPVDLYVGEAQAGVHPLHYQAAWLSRERGGIIPASVMDTFARLRDIALENSSSFEELCVYAFQTARGESGAAQQDNQAP